MLLQDKSLIGVYGSREDAAADLALIEASQNTPHSLLELEVVRDDPTYLW